MGYHDREDDMFDDLARAVYAGDLAKAQAALDDMRRCGIRATQIMLARAAVHPLAPAPDLAKPIVLPAPGVDPREHFGGPGGYDTRQQKHRA